MRNLVLLAGFLSLAACASSSTGDTVTCGAGTTLMGTQCVADGSGSGSGSGSGTGTTCGAGTHLSGTMCVPDGAGATAAPTVTGITPTSAGATGYVLFQIQGTGFAGADITSLHVYFGDTTPGTNGNLGPCEAELGAATPTLIAGEVPPACDLSVTVTVVTNKGMATTPFHYEALFAADGDGGGAFGQAGDLYIIDPYAQLWFDVGPLQNGAGVAYGITGLAFTSTGTLYGVTTGVSPGDSNVGHLVTINPGTAAVTVVGALRDAGNVAWYITDIKMSGTTLYGWGIKFGTTDTLALVTINTTSGLVTPVNMIYSATWTWNGGLAIDANGVIKATYAAGPDTDTMFTTDGALYTINGTTGVIANNPPALDYPIGAPINALAYIGTTMVGVIDHGTYGANSSGGPVVYGEQLAIIDPAATTKVRPLFELPAQLGAQSHVDGIDFAPAGLTIFRTLQPSKWQALTPAAPAGIAP